MTVLRRPRLDQKLRTFIGKLSTPVTIMVVPHSSTNSVRIRVPLAALCMAFTAFLVGAMYIFHTAFVTVSYYEAQRRLEGQIFKLTHSMASLKETDDRLRKILSLESPLPAGDEAKNTGLIDVEQMARQVREAAESIAEIKRYLNEQNDISLATPAGLPVDGPISSFFGGRRHPRTGDDAFHKGIDISVPLNTRVRATADGVVSFSGWSNGAGNTVVLEHGFGFNTVYAHHTRSLVKVGQRIRRGDVVVMSGATGAATGPHLHYEVWKDGKQVNPLSFTKER